jgi:hypothetical protein
MSVSGNWILHFSWGPTSNFSQVPIAFHNDGTFANGSATGKWSQQDGTLLLSFDNGPAKYAGNVEGVVGSGAMSTFGGLNGCWYLTKQGTTGVASATPHRP